MAHALLVIAQQGYQDKEYGDTRAALEHASVAVTVASPQGGECTGKFGGTVAAELPLRDVDAASYDIVAFIGGPGASALKDDPDALRIARDTVAAKKVLGAICIAPTILAAAGVLQDVSATVWDDDGVQSAFLEENGAHYTGEDVTVDGSVVTGNGPLAASSFGRALVGATLAFRPGAVETAS